MTGRPPAIEFTLYSDHMHTVHLPHRNRRRISAHPPTTVDPASQRAWWEALTTPADVRHVLSRLDCEERVNIEGVIVQRTDAFARITFHIADDCTPKGTPKRYDLDAAVARVCELAGGER